MDLELYQFSTTTVLLMLALTLGVLFYICRAVWRDVKEAKKNNQGLV